MTIELVSNSCLTCSQRRGRRRWAKTGMARVYAARSATRRWRPAATLSTTESPTATSPVTAPSLDPVAVSYTHLDVYKRQGLPMGSPISSILAEVLLQHLEKTKILTNNDRHSHKILYWHRYVDDILILYRGNKKTMWTVTVSYTHLLQSPNTTQTSCLQNHDT